MAGSLEETRTEHCKIRCWSGLEFRPWHNGKCCRVL